MPEIAQKKFGKILDMVYQPEYRYTFSEISKAGVVLCLRSRNSFHGLKRGKEG